MSQLNQVKKLLFALIISLSLSVTVPSPLNYHSNSPVIVQAKTTYVYVTPTGKKYHKKSAAMVPIQNPLYKRQKKQVLHHAKSVLVDITIQTRHLTPFINNDYLNSLTKTKPPTTIVWWFHLLL